MTGVDPVELEGVAREAVALCADLLRNYAPDRSHPSYVRPSVSAIPLDRWEEWGRQVLAWQALLDRDPPPEPGSCGCSDDGIDACAWWVADTRAELPPGCYGRGETGSRAG